MGSKNSTGGSFLFDDWTSGHSIAKPTQAERKNNLAGNRERQKRRNEKIMDQRREHAEKVLDIIESIENSDREGIPRSRLPMDHLAGEIVQAGIMSARTLQTEVRGYKNHLGERIGGRDDYLLAYISTWRSGARAILQEQEGH